LSGDALAEKLIDGRVGREVRIVIRNPAVSGAIGVLARLIHDEQACVPHSADDAAHAVRGQRLGLVDVGEVVFGSCAQGIGAS
jgi:hypothetical protein